MEDTEQKEIYSIYKTLDKEKLIKLISLLDDRYIELKKNIQKKVDLLL